jgi:hypothetical protein
MRRYSVALLATGTALIAAACAGDRDASSPSSLAAPEGASRVVTTTCDYKTTMKPYAQAFFASGDAVFRLISNMEDADKNNAHLNPTNRQAAINAAGLAIVKQLATERLTPAQTGTAAAGATFVKYVLGCTNIVVPQQFTDSAALIIKSGILEVRGGTTDATYPAMAFVKAGAPGGSRALAEPRWGVQKGPTNSWIASGATAHSYIVYGYPIDATSQTGVGSPDLINTNEPVPPAVSTYDGFELGTVPAGEEVGVGLLVGLCVSPFQNGSSDVNLLFHNSAIELNRSPSFCSGDPTLLTSTGTKTWYASLTQRVTSLFTATTLFAQDFESRLGGLPSGWSPFHSGKINPTNVGFTFTAPLAPDGSGNVADGTTKKARDYVVHVTNGAGVSAPAGVSVTISIAGNNGTPALFVYNGQPSREITSTTDAFGNATFTQVTIAKAGGYIVTVSGNLAGLATTPGFSPPMFWIKNK